MIASRPGRFINLDQRFQTMSSDSRIALFIDGANLYATAKALGFDIDYRRLLKEFQSRGVLLRASYYTAVIEDQESTAPITPGLPRQPDKVRAGSDFAFGPKPEVKSPDQLYRGTLIG